MKIEVGKKYRMRNYPAPYEYVRIEESLWQYDEEVFLGRIAEKDSFGLLTMSHFCEWGISGNWDNGEGIDDNDLISEVKDVN